MCAARAIEGGGGLVFDRSPPRTRREHHKVVCVSTHLLPLCVSVSRPLDMVSHFPYLVVFRLSLCRSFCLAVILALAICFAARHTRRQEGGGEGDGAKARISEEGTRGRCTVHALVDICRLSGVIYKRCFHRDITERRLCV